MCGEKNFEERSSVLEWGLEIGGGQEMALYRGRDGVRTGKNMAYE